MGEILTLLVLGSLIWASITLHIMLEEFRRFRADYRLVHKIAPDEPTAPE